jgi:Zn-finger nucleic acid-binding protein
MSCPSTAHGIRRTDDSGATTIKCSKCGRTWRITRKAPKVLKSARAAQLARLRDPQHQAAKDLEQ